MPADLTAMAYKGKLVLNRTGGVEKTEGKELCGLAKKEF